MELEAVVEALLGKLDEVADVDGGVLAVQLHADGALVGDDDGDLVSVRFIFWRVECHDSLTSI